MWWPHTCVLPPHAVAGQVRDAFEVVTVPTFWVYTGGGLGGPRQWGFWVYLTGDAHAPVTKRLVMVHLHCTSRPWWRFGAPSGCRGASSTWRHACVYLCTCTGIGDAGAAAPKPRKNTDTPWAGFEPFGTDTAQGGGVWQVNIRHAHLTNRDGGTPLPGPGTRGAARVLTRRRFFPPALRAPPCRPAPR